MWEKDKQLLRAFKECYANMREQIIMLAKKLILPLPVSRRLKPSSAIPTPSLVTTKTIPHKKSAQ